MWHSEDDRERETAKRQDEWTRMRPLNYMMGPIDPRSVYPSYPFTDDDDE